MCVFTDGLSVLCVVSLRGEEKTDSKSWVCLMLVCGELFWSVEFGILAVAILGVFLEPEVTIFGQEGGRRVE